MPEAPEWKFQPLLQDLAVTQPVSAILTGRVITGVDRRIIEDGYVEISGGLIQDVGSDAAARLARGVNGREVIETAGTILAGLINSHAHLAWDGIHDLAAQSLHDPPEVSAYKCATNMLVNLKAGITTLRDLGMNKTNFFAKQAVEQGLFAGPRLLICGEAIVQTGGHTYWCCREASGAEEMRRAVREQIQGGADLIKIMACHDTLEFTDAELEAVVAESHQHNRMVTAHATFDAAIARCATFGIDVIEHGGSMPTKPSTSSCPGRYRSSRPSRRSSYRPSPKSPGSTTFRNGRSRSAKRRLRTRLASTASCGRRRQVFGSYSARTPEAPRSATASSCRSSSSWSRRESSRTTTLRS